MKIHLSVNLFISIIISILLLVVASIPVVASQPSSFISSTSGTPTRSFFETQSEYTSSVNPVDTALASKSLIADTQTTTPTITSSPTLTTTPTSTITKTPVPQVVSTDTSTPTATSTETATPTPLPTQFIYLPYVLRQPTYTPTPNPIPESVLFCDSIGNPINIPDNVPAGINNDIWIQDERMLVNLRLYLDIKHSWVGDLRVNLTNLTTRRSVTVLDRPGSSALGCGYADVTAILADYAAQPVDDQCAISPQAISGIYKPMQSFNIFSNASISGTWRLNVSDNYPNDIGTLKHWCLQADVAEAMPSPTPIPTYVYLPSSASVSGMSGQGQLLNLDCESRSAVDWAKHFGIYLDELDFLNHLPRSDDPEAGFVGDPDGTWGLIPPSDYGVHAPPISSLLQNYGLSAGAYRSLQWSDLQAEIASGKPAIVWIIGGLSSNLVNGTPHLYTAASTNYTTIVAPNEHTVILVGYSMNTNPPTVTVLNGSKFIPITLDQFLDSWSVLNFMAVLARR